MIFLHLNHVLPAVDDGFAGEAGDRAGGSAGNHRGHLALLQRSPPPPPSRGAPGQPRIASSPTFLVPSSHQCPQMLLLVQSQNQKQESSKGTTRLNPNRIWQPPKQGVIKVNMDGAFPTANHMGAIASIARDHTGRMIEGFTRSIQVSSTLETETQALLYTLKDLLQKGKTESHLLLESDNLILVKNINRCHLPPWDCRALFAECAALMLYFPNLSVKHCRREANALAYWERRPTVEASFHQTGFILLLKLCWI